MLLRVGGVMVRPNVSLTPRYEAVKVTGVATDTLPGVTLNVAEVAPCGIVIVVGKFAAAEDEFSVIVAPEAGAGAVSATRQLEALGGVIETGLHEKPFKPNVCWMVTIPPLLDAGKEDPTASDATAFESRTADDVFVVDLDKVKDTLATTPFEIEVLLKPHSTQWEAPGTLLQKADLLAAI